MERSRVARLRDFGQSVWCDDISRDLLLSGGLEKLIARQEVWGVTSNPTIFHKAVAGSTTYDAAVRSLAQEGMTAAEIVEALVVEDIRLACDQLLAVFRATNGQDGWVSVEVAPTLAYDVMGTVQEVMRLRSLVDRPNVMVKVPATAEGVTALRDLTALGYSINVTLIFSLERYASVMEAYLSGLEALVLRRAAGEDLPSPGEVCSVASFFVSRLDTAVDKRLAALMAEGEANGRDTAWLEQLKGKAAVANAKLAYRLFRETFAGPRWQALAAEGANLQRPLWASTSTKNPAYSDILYVQELIGPDTVTTLPLNTMEAFRDHGEPRQTVTVGVEQAEQQLAALASAGLDLAEITAGLEQEGVRAFVESAEALHAAVEGKRLAFLEGKVGAS